MIRQLMVRSQFNSQAIYVISYSFLKTQLNWNGETFISLHHTMSNHLVSTTNTASARQVERARDMLVSFLTSHKVHKKYTY